MQGQIIVMWLSGLKKDDRYIVCDIPQLCEAIITNAYAEYLNKETYAFILGK